MIYGSAAWKVDTQADVVDGGDGTDVNKQGRFSSLISRVRSRLKSAPSRSNALPLPPITGGTMKDTYTWQEIETALWNCGPEIQPQQKITDCAGEARQALISELKSELTRPPIEFAEGEVYALDTPTGTRYYNSKSPTTNTLGARRKQTTQESGAQELIDALEKIANQISVINAISYKPGTAATDSFVIAKDALDKWRKDRGE